MQQACIQIHNIDVVCSSEVGSHALQTSCEIQLEYTLNGVLDIDHVLPRALKSKNYSVFSMFNTVTIVVLNILLVDYHDKAYGRKTNSAIFTQ